MFWLNVFAFTIFWLGATAYTLLAILNAALPYSSSIFWLLLIVLDILGFALILLWYRRYAKTIQLRAGILLASIILVFYWGFATVHSFLSLHLNTLQLRWLGFVYIWEVVIVGIMVTYAVLWVTRFADTFLKGELAGRYSPQDIHVRIASIPLRASVIYIVMVVFGYAIGSLQLYLFSQLPVTEVVKNVLSGLVVGTLSSFVVFFILERIVEPALRKSGVQLRLREIDKRQRFSLFTKIYAISGLLVLVSVGFFGDVSYGRGQTILENDLKRTMLDRLTLIANAYHTTKKMPEKESIAQSFGPLGSLVILTRPEEKSDVALPSGNFSSEARHVIKANANYPASFIERARPTRVIALMPLDSLHTVMAIARVSDFSDDLNSLVFFSLFVVFMIFAAIAIIGTLFAKSIAMPIKEIHEGGVRIGQGDFSRQLGVYTNDELEDLSNALNEASAKLNVSYRYLEQEVSDRTKELAFANQRQQEQIKELDATSKLLVKRDFELQAGNTALQKLDLAKTQFVSLAAHQLRTPLSVSKWTFQMLLSEDFGPLNKEQKEVIIRGNEMNEQMVDLVSDLLDVARIESGKMDYTFKPLDLGTFLPDIRNMFTQKARERRINFSFPVPLAGQYFVLADELRVRMVFQNLLDNAFKFTPSGGKVALLFQPKGELVEFKVMDSGIGIAKEEIPRLFSKFFRARNALAMDTRGTGLGLYIVFNIIKIHNGVISVQSEIGKGTTFTFTLPLARR